MKIGINYRHSSLSAHAEDEEFEVKAGDRMPYFLIDGQNIFDKLQQAKFHFVVFATEPDDFRALQNELESSYLDLADFNLFTMSPEVEEVFSTNDDFSLLLRPDNHVGLISSDNSLSRVRDYLVKFIGSQR